MAVSPLPVFPQAAKTTPQSFVNADGTGKKTVVTAGTNGSRVIALTATSTDTVQRIAQVWLTRAAVSFLLTSVAIPIASGSDGTTPNVDLLSTVLWPGIPFDVDPGNFLYLESGDTLQVSMTVAVTAAKEIDIVSMFKNY
jgi:hypothetical protein